MPHVSAQCQRTLSDEALPVSHQHHEGDPRGGGGHQSPADAARRADPAPRRRALQLAAARAAGAAEGRAHRARGNEPRRGARAGDAGGAAGGAVAGVGPLERLRPGAAAPEGPARARLRAGPHPRGSDHRHRAARAAELPPAAGQLLPDPDQVPRRGAAAVRRDARARVHHEGCLLLSSRCRLAAGRLPRHVRGLHAHLHPHRAHVPRGARRLRRHRRGRRPGILRAGPPAPARPPPTEPLRKVATPGARTIAELARQLNVAPARCVKTLIVAGSDGEAVALVVRGDHELNAVKAQKLPGVATPLTLASAEQVLRVSGTEPGYVGLVGLKCRVYADHSALILADFVCGANEKDQHLTGVNWERDVQGATPADLRKVVEGDPSPSGKGVLKIARGIEVGHIFQLGDKYSRPMKAAVLDEAGREVTLLMGCYGIGVTRIVAAAIEQNHDERGIIWPAPIAPFQVILVPLNLHKSARVREVSDRLYEELTGAGIEVLYDDRDARPGVKFADAELLGIPHRVVVGERSLEAGSLEYRQRRDSTSTEFPAAGALEFLRQRLGG